jgi:hypothetical protein
MANKPLRNRILKRDNLFSIQDSPQAASLFTENRLSQLIGIKGLSRGFKSKD